MWKNDPLAKYGAGDAIIVPPGHYAWVVGNEPVVALDFICSKDYANKSS
jgi:hypothetical protein